MEPLFCATINAGSSWNKKSTNKSIAHWHQSVANGSADGVYPFLLRFLLHICSWFYGLATFLRNTFFNLGFLKTNHIPIPVISVGNLTAGGTGKTPMVEWVAKFIRDLDLRPVILSRGYKGAGGANDEALLLEEHLPDVPHLQGPDRTSLAHTAIEELEAEILILDDGFQHRRIGRDLDILLLDSTNPWGFNHLLPRGTLRETTHGLRRADIIVLTRVDQVDQTTLEKIKTQIHRIKGTITICEATHEPKECVRYQNEPLPLDKLKGSKLLVFCGLGNPQSMLTTLESLGANIVDSKIFPDHHPYTSTDVEQIIDWADANRNDFDFLITSEKDLVKLQTASLANYPLYALSIQMNIRKGEEELRQIINEKVRGKHLSARFTEGEQYV